MSASIYTRSALYRRALGTCAMRGCHADLFFDSSTGHKFTAQAAHIHGENENSARYDPSMTTMSRNSIDNLILMCPTHHAEIDADEETWTAERLKELKTDHERRSYLLSQAGKLWRQKFLTLDYVNVPRLSGMPGGAILLSACEEAGLKPGMTPRDIGFGVGGIVGAAVLLLAQWDARVVSLSEMDLVGSDSVDGRLVWFDQLVYTRNCPEVDKRAPLTGDFRKDPHIWFRQGNAKVYLRYDPEWITTNTAYGNLREGTVRFAGIGLICRRSDDEIVISAWALGKPMTPELEMFYG
ncbi:hypothetical protein Chelonae_p4234 [[Mycobacterium] chelonae subsp. bovistauri]|nr:hypothetical protein Chelonae_p4234 [Mycobacterium sp. QIA-37]